MDKSEIAKTKEELTQEAIDRIVSLYLYHYDQWQDRNEQISVNNSMVRPTDQWSEDDRTRLTKDFRPCLTINKIGPLVRQLLGLMLQNEITLKVERVGAEDDAIAEVLTGILAHILYNDDNDYLDTIVQADGIIGGMGNHIVRIEKDPLTEKRSIVIEVQENTELYIDPNARSLMQKDWKQVMRAYWLRKDEIMALWGEQKDEEGNPLLVDGAPLLTDDDFSVTELKGWWNGLLGRFKSILRDSTPISQMECYKNGKYKIIEDWSLTTEEIDVWFDPLENRYVKEEPEYDGLVQWGAKTIRVPVIKLTQYHPYSNKILNESPYPYKFFPVTIYTPMSLNLKIIDAQGFVEDLIGIQQELNIGRSAEADIIARGPNGTIIFHKDDDDLMEDMKKYGSTPGYKGISKSSVGIPKVLEMQIPPALFQYLLQNDKDWIDIGLIPPASRGLSEGRGESGVLYNLKIMQGNTAIAMIVKNWVLCQRLKGKIILEMIPDVYTREDVIEILGDDRWNSILERQPDVWERIQNRDYSRYDVTIEETPMAKSQRQQEWAQFSEEVKSMPDEMKAAVFPDIIRLSSLDHAEETAVKLEAIAKRLYGGAPPRGETPPPAG